jgi:hypothetical protein
MLISNIKQRIFKAIGSLLLTISLWQGISLGIDSAWAAPPIADSAANIVDRVENRVEAAKDRLQGAMQDGDKSDRKMMDDGKITSDANADLSEKYSGDTPEKVQATADRNSKQAQDFSRKNTEKAKNFLGF